MKKIFILIFCAVITGKTYSQANTDDLPPEFKDIATQAFQKLSPQTKQWFSDAAKQHPAGSFDTAWARKKLSERFSFTEINDFHDIMMVMMEYQKMVNKEARENRRIAAKEKQVVLASKKSKIKMDNKKIDQAKQESQEKSDNAMTAAQTNLWLGIINGTITTTGTNIQQSNPKIVNAHIATIAIQNPDSTGQKKKNADPQKEINKQENQASKDDKAKKESEDHKKAMEDAMKKLLDQMARMKPELNP